MQLQKYLILTLFIISFSFSNLTFTTQQTQDTIQVYDKEAFKASLKDLPPKEFSRLFMQQYKQDSIKVTLCLEHIKNNMLYSENLDVQFWGYFSLANSQNDMLDQKSSINSLEKALLVAKKIGDNALVMNVLMSKGIHYFDFGAYEKAMENYLEVLHLAKQLKDKKREQAVSLNIALIKMQTNDYKGANELLHDLLESIKNESLKVRHLRIYIALTKACIGIGDYAKAKHYCQKGLLLSDELNYSESKFYFYSFLAEIALKDGDYKKAHKSIEKSLQINQNTNTLDYEVPILFITKGKVFYEEKNYKAAIEVLLKAESLMQQHKLNFIRLEETYALLGKSYKEIGDLEKSLQYYEKANEAYKTNDKRQGNISTNIVKKYDLAEIKSELDLAKKSSENKNTWLVVSSFSIVCLIIGFGIIYKKREKENKKKFQKILETSSSDNNDSSKETQVKEEAKNYISDAIAQKLLQKLKSFEEKKIFLKKDTTLATVASKLNTNPTYLSKTINKHKGKSFNNYINELRLNYVIDRLKRDEKFRLYTIEAIAKEIGYLRAAPFSKAFKLKTGISPSYFIKELENKGK